MGSRISVLLVDDDDAILELTETYLTRIDETLDVTAETSPEAALERVRDGEGVECVVSDYNMPAMDGLELFEAVQDVDGDLPFILFTGRGSEEIASDAISAGVTDYLQKGAGREQYEVLANRVRNAVSRSRAEREAAASRRRLSRVIDRISDAFFSVDRDWTIEFANDRTAEHVGESREDLVGSDLRNVIPESEAPKSYELYRRALDTQDPQSHQVTSAMQSGVWLEERAFPAENGVSVYFRDVTERVNVRRQLRETNEKITALHDVATDLRNCETPAAVYDVTLEAAEDIIELDLCAADAVVDGHLVPQSVSDGLVSDDVYRQTPVSDEDSLGARTYRTGESVLVRDAELDDAVRDDLSYRSVLSAPVGDHGVFQAVNADPDAFTERDLELVEILLSHIAAALGRLDADPDAPGE